MISNKLTKKNCADETTPAMRRVRSIPIIACLSFADCSAPSHPVRSPTIDSNLDMYRGQAEPTASIWPRRMDWMT